MDPSRTAKFVRRIALPVILIAFIALWMCFGTLRVAQGMDTLTGTTFGGQTRPPVPAGSLCVVDKRGSAATPGMAVFVELDDGSVLLSRVRDVTDDGLILRHDNPASRLPDSDSLGPIPRSAVLGVVLVVFPPESEGGQ